MIARRVNNMVRRYKIKQHPYKKQKKKKKHEITKREKEKTQIPENRLFKMKRKRDA